MSKNAALLLGTDRLSENNQRYVTTMHSRKIELYLRHMHEGGAKIAEFLIAHSDINPHFIEDMTSEQAAELNHYISDLATAQQIERGELDSEEHSSERLTDSCVTEQPLSNTQ